MKRNLSVLMFLLLPSLAVLYAADDLPEPPTNWKYPPEMAGARVEIYRQVGDVKLNAWIFEPKGHSAKDRRPAIVFFFGGGWNGGTPGQFLPQCLHLAERGMVAISVDYRVKSRQGVIPQECVRDAKAAIRWVRANAARLGVDPDRIAAGGGSAGGHLAAAVAMVPGFEDEEKPAVSSMPNALVLFNPAVILAPVDGHPKLLPADHAAALRERMNGRPQEISPYHFIRRGLPPSIIFHGTNDEAVPYETVVAFQKAMTAAGNRCELKSYAGQPHGFFNPGRGQGEARAEATRNYYLTLRELDTFLESLGYLKPATAAANESKPESREDAAARIRQMEQIADLALVPPKLNTSPLPEYGSDRLDYGMTIGIERTPGGRLWACWVAGGDSPKAFFVLATSDDDGEHWSPPRLVVDSHAKDLPRPRSILVGNLWTDPLGRLWLIFDQSMDMFDGRAGVWATICENPDAAEPTWSPPRRIWHGVTLNKPTALSTGEWMLPNSLDQRGGFGPFKGCFAELDPMRGANVFVSTDQGETWQRRGMATFPNPDWHEHMIVERRDGSLWMLARTATGIMQTSSTDGGRTWSAPTEPAGIRQPNARFHVRRLASGRLLLVKHGDAIDAHHGRVQLSAWLSDDDGQNWNGGLILDERKGVSYPDGFQSPDGTIYISYDRNRATDGEILLARFTEEDVLAKTLVGPKSKLKLLISRPLAIKKENPSR